MATCQICGSEAKTTQGLGCHIRLKHPGQSANDGSLSPDGVERQSMVVHDPDPPARLARSAELERRFVQTLDRLDQVPQAIEALRERIGQIESSLDEDGELMDRLTNIDLTVSGLLDRLEEAGDDSESEGKEPVETTILPPQMAEVSEPKGFWDQVDADLKEFNPAIYSDEN